MKSDGTGWSRGQILTGRAGLADCGVKDTFSLYRAEPEKKKIINRIGIGGHEKRGRRIPPKVSGKE